MKGATRETCDTTVSVGLNAGCVTAFASFEGDGLCGGSDAAAAEGGTDGSQDAADDPDPCGTFATCCGGADECVGIVDSKNSIACAEELSSYRSSGSCVGQK